MMFPLFEPSISGKGSSWSKQSSDKMGESRRTWVVIMKMRNVSGIGYVMKIYLTPNTKGI